MSRTLEDLMRIGFALAAALAIYGCAPKAETLTDRTQLQGAFVAFVVTPTALGDARAVEAAARRECSEESYCWLLGYRSVSEIPDPNLPVVGQGKRPVFAYTKNDASGLDRILFDCQVFQGLPERSCAATTADTEQRGSPGP
jgi:hypothetical protein